MAPDGRLYNSGRKGELYELKQGLNSTTAKERKTALKRTVAAMTLGKDVSSLFADVIKNTAADLSMKKLVYLYIINYAKSNPELALLVVNTFIKDAADPHPLIRALAIRTMALIPLENVTEYLCDPLRAALADRDPYVQKTAAIAVAKLHDTNPDTVREEGFIPLLQRLVSANNPMTVANAVAALAEIADATGDTSVLELTSATVPRFLASLSECTEWGQVFILDAVSTYRPSGAEEADTMVERIVPRLQHTNAAVVLSAVRLIVLLMPQLDSNEKRDFLTKKMGPPLLSLLTAPPEMQFVALRNLNLLAGEYPELLSGNVKMFFASYSDPLYVKIEKLEILVRLANANTGGVILTELREYTDEVDVAFVRRAVASIGRVAIKESSVSERAVTTLVDLLTPRAPHVVEEVAVALADILRAYPGQYDFALIPLCAAAEVVGDPVARSALVWIIGEHAAQIPNVVAILSEITEGLQEEVPEVQLQILSACFKALLVCGDEASACFRNCTEFATVESGNIDVRERGFLYARLAEANREDVRKVVLSPKPGVNANVHNLDPELLKELLASLSSLAAVYHKPPASFRGVRERGRQFTPASGITGEEDLLGLSAEPDTPGATQAARETMVKPTNGNSGKNLGTSLLDELFGNAPAARAAATSPGLLALTGTGAAPASALAALSLAAGNTASGNKSEKVLLSPERGNGLLVRGGVARNAAGQTALALTLENHGSAPMSSFAIQMNKNAFALGPSSPLRVPEPLAPGASATVSVALAVGPEADLTKGTSLQIAFKFSAVGAERPHVVYFAAKVSDSLDVLLERSGVIPKSDFLAAWQSLPDSTEVVSEMALSPNLANNADGVIQHLHAHRIFLVAKRTVQGRKLLFFSGKIAGPWECAVMCELSMPLPGTNVAKFASRCVLGASGKPFLDSLNVTCARLLQG